jgi:hypothetical protein
MENFFQNIGSFLGNAKDKVTDSDAWKKLMGFYHSAAGSKFAGSALGALALGGLGLAFTGGGLMGMLVAIPLAFAGIFLGRNWAESGSLFGGGAHAATTHGSIRPHGRGHARAMPVGPQQQYEVEQGQGYGSGYAPAFGAPSPYYGFGGLPSAPGVMFAPEGGYYQGGYRPAPQYHTAVRQVNNYVAQPTQHETFYTSSPTQITRVPVQTSLTLNTSSPTAITHVPNPTSLTLHTGQATHITRTR